MPAMKLTYFEFSARAESSRLAFVVGGIEFEDHRITSPLWKDIKPTTPYGSIPILSVDGEVLAQSTAILRYVGKLGGLYPSDPLAALKVDEVVETTVDLAVALYGYTGNDLEKLKAHRSKFVSEVVPRYAGALDKRLGLFGEGVYAVDGKVSIADLAITCFINDIKSGMFDYICPDTFSKYPNLMAVHNAVMELPSVVAWYKKNPINYRTPKME